MTNSISQSANVPTDRQPVKTINLSPGAHVHFMGICGTAMASLAGLLHSRGYKVTGSDQNVYPPRNQNYVRLQKRESS
jgi:UDP-N-acetylmuramate-alanine ligase